MKQSGVYYREFDLSQIISADANLPAAIVFASKKGAINTRKLITSNAQWDETYGYVDPKISFAPYCAKAYLDQGNQLWATRVAGFGYDTGALMLQKKAADLRPVLHAFAVAGNPEDYDFSATLNGSSSATENLLLIHAIGPGSYSKDLQLEIVSPNLIAPTGGAGVVQSSAGGLASAAYQYKVTATNQFGETEASAQISVTVASGSTNAILLTWTEVQGAQGYKIYGRTAADAFKLLDVTSTPSYLDTGAADVGTISAPAASSIPASDEFTLRLYDTSISSGKAIEEHVVTLKEKLDGFGRQMKVEDVINNQSNYLRVVNNASLLTTVPAVFGITKTTFGEGDSGLAVTDSDIINGWKLYEDVEKVYVRILINGGYSTPAVQKYLVQLAEKRGDCIAFLDIPSLKQKAQDAVDYRNVDLNINTNRAALFAQDLLVLDTYNNKQLYVPPSGHMAALAARSAFVTAPWYPMAGLNRGQLTVLGVRNQYDEGQRELLRTAQINYVRNFPGQGLALFEQVTAQAKQSALSWISVRQLIDEIQIAVRKFLLYSVHELNDDFTRRQIVTGIGQFLQDIQNRRGLQKFLVVSDDRNNTEQSVGEGKLNVHVYLTPTLPAEQVILTSVITRQGADFAELVAQNL